MKDHKGYEQWKFDRQDAIVLVACSVTAVLLLLFASWGWI